MTTGLIAIETEHLNQTFRSRQEARWAECFDALGVFWRYEVEGFKLNGVWYLPDFLLPLMDRWVEVKGRPPTEAEFRKATALAQHDPDRDVIITWEHFSQETAHHNIRLWHDENGVFRTEQGWRWLPDAECGWAAARSMRFDGYRPRRAWPGLDWGETQYGELPY